MIGPPCFPINDKDIDLSLYSIITLLNIYIFKLKWHKQLLNLIKIWYIILYKEFCIISYLRKF